MTKGLNSVATSSLYLRKRLLLRITNFHFHANLLAQMACQFPEREIRTCETYVKERLLWRIAVSPLCYGHRKNIGNTSPALQRPSCLGEISRLLHVCLRKLPHQTLSTSITELSSRVVWPVQRSI